MRPRLVTVSAPKGAGGCYEKGDFTQQQMVIWAATMVILTYFNHNSGV